MPIISGGGSGGGSVPYVTGAGSPVGAVTPTTGKPLYIDTTNGTAYLALGATDLDWIALGPVAGNIGEVTGVVYTDTGGTRPLYIMAGERDTAASGKVYIGSAYAQWNGHTQGIYWDPGSGEGAESAQIITGATGQHLGILQDGSGNLKPANTINVADIPTSNPGPGLLWNNAGSLAIGT